MALPALWAGGEPPRIADTLLDALREMLQPAFVFVRLHDPEGGPLVEMMRAGASGRVASAREVGEMLDLSLGTVSSRWPPGARVSLGDADVRVATARLGLQGEFGVVVAGCQRLGFPEQAERLLLDVAANQATIGLQQARLLDEHRRRADDLDERVARRTSELAATNEALKKEVAERGRAEAALRSSELNLRQMTETIPEMLWSATPEGAIDYCNARFLDYTGFSVDELMGDGWQKALHPEDAYRVAPVWMASVATGTPYRVDVRTFHRADRTYRWCAVSARPLLDRAGRVLKWHGTIVDMHDWKQAEQKLRRSEAFLAEAQHLSSSGSFSW